MVAAFRILQNLFNSTEKLINNIFKCLNICYDNISGTSSGLQTEVRVLCFSGDFGTRQPRLVQTTAHVPCQLSPVNNILLFVPYFDQKSRFDPKREASLACQSVVMTWQDNVFVTSRDIIRSDVIHFVSSSSTPPASSPSSSSSPRWTTSNVTWRTVPMQSRTVHQF